MTGASSFIGWNAPAVVLILAMITEFIMILTSGMWARKENGNMNIGLFLFFTCMSGLTLVPILKWGLNIGGVGMLAQAFGVTSVTFGALSLYGITTKKDFTGIGGFLFAALIGLIISSIATMLVGGGSLAYLFISVVSVLVFSAFIVYDIAMIRRNYSDQDYVFAAIALYLDFIGLFQNILRIFGIFGSSSDD
jgi:FtsH-binding integral membrane protein